jgi:uncharacterized membrane protein YqiK
MELIGTLLGGLIVAVIVIAIVVKLLAWLYMRATGDVAFVRTGAGGAKVVRDGGALVIPVVHRTTPVNLATLRVEVKCTDRGSVQTRDSMRMDVHAAFYLHVGRDREDILRAATTLGERTNSAEAIAHLLEGKFVDAIRAEAAEMEMHTLHQKRGDFVRKVAERVQGDLAHNGLELESVSLLNLDQAAKENFNPQNAFDAEGLTRLSKDIEDRRRIRNEIERDTEVALQRKALEVEGQQLQIEKAKLEIVREQEFARLAQQQEIALQRARQGAQVKREESQRLLEGEQASIEAQREIQNADTVARQLVEMEKVRAEQALSLARVEADRALRLAGIAQTREIDLAVAEREADITRASLAQIDARGQVDVSAQLVQQRVKEAEVAVNATIEQARSSAELEVARKRIQTEQAIRTAETAKALALDLSRVLKERDLELAEHDRVIAVSGRAAQRFDALVVSMQAQARAAQSEQGVVAARESAKAEGQKQVADIEAARARIAASGSAEVERIKLQTEAERLAVEATGKSQLYAAENTMAGHVIELKTRLASLDALPDIIRESAKPMEAIDNLSIVQVEGLHGPLGGGDGAAVGGGNLADQMMNSALRYRAQAPLVDRILQDVGMDGSSLAGLAAGVAPLASIQALPKKERPEVLPPAGSGNPKRAS